MAACSAARERTSSGDSQNLKQTQGLKSSAFRVPGWGPRDEGEGGGGERMVPDPKDSFLCCFSSCPLFWPRFNSL